MVNLVRLWIHEMSKNKELTLCFALTNADKGLRALLIWKWQDKAMRRIMIEYLTKQQEIFFWGFILQKISQQMMLLHCQIICTTTIDGTMGTRAYFLFSWFTLMNKNHQGQGHQGWLTNFLFGTTHTVTVLSEMIFTHIV